MVARALARACLVARRRSRTRATSADVPFFTLLVAAIVALGVALRRSNELFVLRVRDGSIRVVRGRPPARLMADIDEVVAQTPPVVRASLRVVVEDGRPVLRVAGDISSARLQRLRNVLGLWPLARLGR